MGGNPDQPKRGRNDHCGNVIYRKRNTGRTCYVFRAGNLLKVRLDGNCQGEEHVVDDVQACPDVRILNIRVGRKDEDQADILDRQRLTFTDSPDQAPDSFCEEPIERVVDQE